jgi:hypothetical protein
MPPLQNGSPTVATKHAERAHTNTLTREKARAVLASPCTPARPRPRVVVCGGRRSVAFCRRRRFKSHCIHIQTVATGQQNYKHAKHHCAAAAEKERILRPRRHTSTTPDPDAGWTDDDGHATFVCFPADNRGGFLARIKEGRRQRIGTRLQRPLAAAAAEGRRTNGDDETHRKKRRR